MSVELAEFDPLIGHTIADRFLIQARVGSGGMGSVYRAMQLGLDRDIALKLLAVVPDGLDDLVGPVAVEADALAELAFLAEQTLDLGIGRVQHLVDVLGCDAEFLGITGLNRSDWLLRAMMVWKAGARSRVRAGVDVFGGDMYGLFGQFGNRDRVWAEYPYSF